MQKNNLIAKFAIAALTLAMTSFAFGANKGAEKVTLTCEFPPAEAPQRVKPGHKNVSDGVIRITEQKLTLSICHGCAWEKTGAKWKVTAKEYQVQTDRGVSLTINKGDGSALFAITTKGDEYYQSGHAESRGQCKAAEAPAATKP